MTSELTIDFNDISYTRKFANIFTDEHRCNTSYDSVFDLHDILTVGVNRDRLSDKLAINVMNYYLKHDKFLKPLYDDVVDTLKNGCKVDEIELKLIVANNQTTKALLRYRQMKDMKNYLSN